MGLARVVLAAVLAASACEDPPRADDEAPIGLPSRYRDAGEADAGVLDPIDAGVVPDAGERLCDEPDLVLCLDFEDTLADGSPSSLSPSEATEIRFAPGKHGRALELTDATVLRFDHAPALEVSTATVEAWVYRDVLSFGDDTVFDDEARFSMTIEQGGTLRCAGGPTSARGGTVPIATWTHVACTFDGTSIAAWVDGAKKAAAKGAPATNAETGAAVGAGFVGKIDALRVFSRALAAPGGAP